MLHKSLSAMIIQKLNESDKKIENVHSFNQSNYI